MACPAPTPGGQVVLRCKLVAEMGLWFVLCVSGGTRDVSCVSWLLVWGWGCFGCDGQDMVL